MRLKVKNKSPERPQWYSSNVFIVSFEHISHNSLVFPLLNLNNTDWGGVVGKITAIPKKNLIKYQISKMKNLK